MVFDTYDRLDVPHGEEAMRIYRASFPQSGRKPDAVIQAMFDRRMAYLHTESIEDRVTAMAITGVIPQANVLLIDYLAVAGEVRGRGIGRRLVQHIAGWAREEKRLAGIILEAEADPGEENEERFRFWQRCGFTSTEYVHKYIWVPETYRALYMAFDPEWRVSDRGETMFRWIGNYHRKAFAR
ncbi:GNAT family N-acetyltransferase [Cohnella sp. CFH 77786]|uniref:GNAT family N-acetyltransferase n=1 Tax=Cohnella sp. CFH 77786 TaxID=2662265 RepID=UPI001C60BB7E|nr:GNAT family N-acetyltransferase [Cohnella sp. CFH 77786]MBW5446272.1 GNAT family N-acetyltransferase [Cohnella sp. CFH 77786]